MILPVRHFQALQQSNLNVCVAHLARPLSEFAYQFKHLLLIFSFRSEGFDQSFNPAAVGAKMVDVFRGQILRKAPDVAIHPGKDQAALVLRNAQVRMITAGFVGKHMSENGSRLELGNRRPQLRHMILTLS